jgi:TonB-dependent SusC/RagA subfamily outer membrane receptor
LHGIRYTGATQLGAVNLDVPNADVVLLFTDGKSNYGKSDPKTGTTPIFAIVTTGENNLKLSNIIGLTGGSIIAINKDNLGNSVQKATVIKELLLNITANNGLLTLDQNLDTFLQSKTTLSGQISAAASELIFHYGNFKSGSQKVIKISKNNDCTNSSIERMNMLSKFEKINANYGWENSLLFGRTEKIITQQTAYLVLERIEDYIKYQITPPKDIEHIVKNNPSYVAAPKLDPVKFSKEEVELSYLKGIAIYYNQRIAEWDKAQKQIDIASIKSNTQLKYERKVEQEIAAKKEFASSLENMDAREINIGKSFMENDKALNSEVVVVSVGYGSKKQFMAGAVSSVNSNQLLGYNNLAQALQGRVPGLQVYQNSNPGAVPSIRLRGASSFSGNGNPLFVLDGMPITDDYALNILNPNDIQNVTVLRDLQAAALYGSRAYNGAIVINTKKGKYYYQNIFSSYKLKNQEDVEYINEFKETDKTYQYAKYLELRKLHGFDKTFYFDIAELFYLQGSAETAKEIISNAVEIAEENSNVLQAVAFYFDKWGMYEDAQELYKQLIEKNPSGLQYYRNLALSYQLQGKYQEALNTYNEAILIAVNAPVQKALVLNELNALIGAQQGKLDLEAINPALIKVLPMEVRIVVETNSYNYQTAMVSTKNVQLNKNSNHYNSYYYNQNGCLPLQEFLYKEAKEKKFEVQVNYYGNYYTPDVYRIITYKNFGKANQTINVENVILDNQYGKVSIHEFNL